MAHPRTYPYTIGNPGSEELPSGIQAALDMFLDHGNASPVRRITVTAPNIAEIEYLDHYDRRIVAHVVIHDRRGV